MRRSPMQNKWQAEPVGVFVSVGVRAVSEQGTDEIQVPFFGGGDKWCLAMRSACFGISCMPKVGDGGGRILREYVID